MLLQLPRPVQHSTCYRYTFSRTISSNYLTKQFEKLDPLGYFKSMASVGKFLKQNTSLVYSKSLHVRISRAGFSASFQQLNYIIRKTDAEVMTCLSPRCSPYDTIGLVYVIGRCIPNAIPGTSLLTFCRKFEFFFSTGNPILAKTMSFVL